DMIHLQQIATPVHDIAAGLCLALARSFMSTVAKGASFERPVAFLGGVASNSGMVMAFEKVLNLGKGELIIPSHHRTLSAIGAALTLLEEERETPFHGVDALRTATDSREEAVDEHQPRLRPFLTPAGTPDLTIETLPDGDGKVDAYIGIDIGSISTNVVAIDSENRILSKRYLWTASQPIEAVRKGLDEIRDEIGGRITVRGAATTGSGRYLIGELVGADVIRNEITAQATAAIFLDPRVDTIFEIGGQDSKYISIDHGTVCDFEMNKACAAGTGSFLSEQAERLGVDLKEEFSSFALDAPRPVSLGDRCTVFMESDLVQYQQRGAETPDLLAGLAYSIVHNYLNRVVGDRRIGEHIFFQGGTAFNKAVVAAFNSVLGKEIIVPPHHEVTGAIGAAMLARDKSDGTTRFRGFDFSNLKYEVKSFVCKSCDNLCEIRRVQLEGERPLYYGSRCEKYEVDHHVSAGADLPDLFAEREALLHRAPRPGGARPATTRGTVGIPLALSFHDFLPFWRTFFEELGFEVILSGETTKTTVHKGVESVVNETCFPVKVAHGHILQILEKKPDFLFLPSLVDSKTEDFGPQDRSVFNCPLVQTIPYTAASAIDFSKYESTVLTPALHMQWGLDHVEKEMSRYARALGASRTSIRRALRQAQTAQDAFFEALEKRGREILDTLPEDQTALVIVSRPYNGCDLGLNLDLPKKIRNLGALPIPMDMLPLSEVALPEKWRKVYWRYGQRILKAAEVIKTDPRLFAVYITNFSCGPDSFLLDYFRGEMAEKPHLLLEIDEHSADAGLITRCEAFLDTLENLSRHGGRRTVETSPWVARQFTNHRRLYLPNMSAHAYPLAAALRSVGIEAEVMDESNEESIYWGERFTSGRECYPCLLTTGDIVRQTRQPDFDPKRSAFFMASADGPCRFGQYNRLHRGVLDKLGLEDVPIFALEQDSEYDTVTASMGPQFERRAWNGIAAVDCLEKLALEKRPFETEPGQTDAWFQRSVALVSGAIQQSRGELLEALPGIRRDYEKIAFERKPDCPLIALVGEVYVRANVFANSDLVRNIESLGGQAAVPTMSEWIQYTRLARGWRHKAFGKYGKLLGLTIADHVLHGDENKIYGFFGRKPDPSPARVIEHARPYLDPSFQGEAILTIGKAVELVQHEGAVGIVNTMPFTCMPGTICTALLKRVREDHDDIPVLNLAFTGQQTLNNRIRLEAFLYQAREYREKRDERACAKQ
ncbi:CoA activase, partial [bacterium]|nr:CoA activase [bacterium]